MGLLKSRPVPYECTRVQGLRLFHIFSALNSVWYTAGAGEISVECMNEGCQRDGFEDSLFCSPESQLETRAEGRTLRFPLVHKGF